MSWDIFEKNRAAIARLVAKIVTPKSATRKDLRLKAVYEKKSNEMIAEVFKTPFGPVVVWADAEHGGTSERISDSGRGRHIAPLTRDPNQQFLIRARSKSYVVMGTHFDHEPYPEGLLTFK